MNDTSASITISRERVANVVAALTTLTVGDLNVDRIKETLQGNDDEFGELEQLLCQLAVDLRIVVEASETYIREIEANSEELEDKLRTIERQQLAIQDLSTPVIELWEDILTLPIVGVVDTKRSAEMAERLLHAIVEHQAKCIIIDVTGVDIIDTATADHFVKMFRAAAMLGAYCVVSGISAHVAQTLTRLGIELQDVRTLRTLKDALRHCFRHLRDQERAPTADGARVE